MKSWATKVGKGTHGLTYRAIARTFAQGYKGSRICKEYGISESMLEAILVDYGEYRDLRQARTQIRTRENNGKKKTRKRRADIVQP